MDHLQVIESVTPAMAGLLLSRLTEEELAKLKKEKEETLLRRIHERPQEFAQRELKDDPEILRLVASITVISGDPANEILKKLHALNGDILIIGTHGKGFVEHTFLGSVAEKILHRTRKPIVVIPLPKGETDMTLGEV